MRAYLVAATLLGSGACIVTSSDPCDEPAQEVYDTRLLDYHNGQAYLNTPAAAKECHAVFTARLAYTGDDAFDPALEMPLVDVSANAVGTGGEQPGLLGIMTSWGRVEDDQDGSISWWAEFDAGAKNIDAPSVIYGMAAVLQPGQTLTVDYYAQITFRPPPAEEPAARLGLRASQAPGCRAHASDSRMVSRPTSVSASAR